MTLRPPIWLLIPVLPALLAGCAPDTARAAGSGADIFEVKRGRRTISIKENAELAAAVETRVRSEMEGQNTVIALIKEGSRVQKGDKLVELDAAQVVEKKATQEIQVARAHASRVSAQKALEIQLKQNEAELLAARNEHKIALMNQEKFYGREKTPGAPGSDREMGEQEQLRKDAEDAIRLAKQELKLAEDRLLWSQKLKAKDFITKNELERDELDAERKRYQVVRSENERALLEHYDLQIKELEVQQAVREAELALERVQAQGEAKLAQAQAELESAEAEFKLAKERLDNLEAQLRNAVITAPNPGLVVYAFEGDGMRRREVVEEGAQVRQRQTLIILPDITKMVAHLSVHEAMVDKVSVGQPAIVRVDAFPDRALPGHVASVAALADSSQRWANPTAKYYKTVVAIDGEPDFLKPNMTASCEIIIAVHEDVLFVPVQAVQRQGAVPYVWLETNAGPVAQRVELGVHDYSFVIVNSGVKEGGHVYLAPPPGVTPPTFPQPEQPVPAPIAVPDASVAGGSPRGGEGGRRGFGSGRLTELRELLLRKHPEFAQVMEEDRRALMVNEDIKKAIEADPELKAKYDEAMAAMRQMGGERGGRRGRRGEGGGGDGPAEGGGPPERGGDRGNR